MTLVLTPVPVEVEFEKVSKKLKKQYDRTMMTEARKDKLARVRIKYAKKQKEFLVECMKEELEIMKDKKLDLAI